MGADPRDPETRSQASGPGGVALRLGYQGGASIVNAGLCLSERTRIQLVFQVTFTFFMP